MALRRTFQKSDALVRQLLAPLKMPSQHTLPIQLPGIPKPVKHPDFKISNGDTLFPRLALAEQHNNGGNAGKKPPEDFAFIYSKK